MRRVSSACAEVVCVLASYLASSSAFSATVSYDLELNNLAAYSGQTLARVTLTDTSAGVDFLVQALIPGSKLQRFGFNFLNDVQPSGFAIDVDSLPPGWAASININQESGFNGFGKFDVSVGASGNPNRLSSLTFSTLGGSVTDYVDLSHGNAGIEQSLFAAHITDLGTAVLTGFAGGGTIVPSEVPVPAAFWLFGSGLIGIITTAARREFC